MIYSTNGVFSWATSLAQNPGVFSFTIRVSDNGTPPLSDEKSFTITVMGPAGPFRLNSLSIAEGKFGFTWNTEVGKKYQAQYKNDLNDPDWLVLGTEISGDGTSVAVTNAVGTSSQRFFRVIQLP
jgi:hypothetical protein